MTVDRAEVIREVDVDAGGHQGSESEEQGVCGGKELVFRNHWGYCLELIEHTEDEFFRRGQHVKGKGHFVLVDLEADPANNAAQNPEKRLHCCDMVYKRKDCEVVGFGCRGVVLLSLNEDRSRLTIACRLEQRPWRIWTRRDRVFLMRRRR